MVLHRPALDRTKNRNILDDGKNAVRLLDDLNMGIVKELLVNPGASSTDIADMLKVPVSTIQRRRVKLEESVLAKTYYLDVQQLGWRTADLLICVEKGKTEETAQKLLRDNKTNVIMASLRIGHPKVDIMPAVFYKDSIELHNLTGKVRSMPYVTYVEWAEVVKVVGSNFTSMLNKISSKNLS
jgi:DNA-binding Lrp family transcriptional regulator